MYINRRSSSYTNLNKFSAANGSPDSICDRIRVTSDILVAHAAIQNQRNCNNLISNLPEAYDLFTEDVLSVVNRWSTHLPPVVACQSDFNVHRYVLANFC